ncbi:hypothetical protein COCNU_scaffold006362G000030 [Cocos nucifera]|nr:hypothetical protein [Cocos nucifera]
MGGWWDAHHVRSAPAHGPAPRNGGAPYHPGGASRIAPPRGFQSTEQHCKWAGDGMRVPWAWRSGLAGRGPESLANPPLRTPERGRPAHACGVPNPPPARPCAAVAPPNTPAGHPGNPNPGGSKGPSGIANRGWGGRRAARTSVPHSRAGLGPATEAPPTTPGGHPGKPHPGGSNGPSGIANGRVPGCASRGHGAPDLCSGVPNPPPTRPCAAVAGKPHPGGSKGPSGIANGLVAGCASRVQWARDLRCGDPNLGPPYRYAQAGRPRAGHPGARRAGSGHGSTLGVESN